MYASAVLSSNLTEHTLVDVWYPNRGDTKGHQSLSQYSFLFIFIFHFRMTLAMESRHFIN
jgi:hypothetical protein